MILCFVNERCLNREGSYCLLGMENSEKMRWFPLEVAYLSMR